MIPTPGRIVEYTLSEDNARAINKRREDASSHMSDHRRNASGEMIHAGNPAQAGQSYPLLIIRVWDGDRATEGSAVNGQVMLDGNDTLWVTSVTQQTEGEGRRHGSWREYKRSSVGADLMVARSEPGADDLRKAALETLQRIAGNTNQSAEVRMHAAALLLAEAEKRADAGKGCDESEAEQPSTYSEHYLVALGAQRKLLNDIDETLAHVFEFEAAPKRRVYEVLTRFHKQLNDGALL